MEEKHIALELFLCGCFHIFRFIYNLVQAIKWRFNGIKSVKLKSEKEENFDWSAQLHDIIVKYSFDSIGLDNTIRNFCLRHQGFQHPKVILNAEVSLYSVTEHEAVFVVAPSGVETWRKKYGAFHKMAQLDFAEKVITMPLSSFFKVCDTLDDPGSKLTFVTFIPRSGSTLLCRVFEDTGQVVSYSEPGIATTPFIHLPSTYHSKPKFSKRYLRAIVKYMCRPRVNSGRQTEAYMMKLHEHFSSDVILLYRHYFPKANFLFLHRNASQCLLSNHCMVHLTRLSRLFHFFRPVIPSFVSQNIIITHFQLGSRASDDELLKIIKNSKHPDMLYNVFTWAVSMSRHINPGNNNVVCPTIKYEDIVSNPEKSIRAIFKHCNIPLDLVHKGLDAFKEDCQEGTQLSRRRVSAVKHLTLLKVKNPTFQAETEAVLHHYRVPPLGQDVKLPNNLTS